jgi:hypothetical protein
MTIFIYLFIFFFCNVVRAYDMLNNSYYVISSNELLVFLESFHIFFVLFFQNLTGTRYCAGYAATGLPDSITAYTRARDAK